MATATYTPMRDVSLGAYRGMETRPGRSKRPLLILSAIFIVSVVVVGAVVWKVTKDAYDTDDEAKPSVSGEEENLIQTKRGWDEQNQPWKQIRLPRNILPVHYDITMYPDIYDGAATFHGNVSIELKITKPTNWLWFHVDSDYMKILNADVFNATGGKIKLGDSIQYKRTQVYVLEAEGEKFQDTATLKIQFQGAMDKSMEGIYKSSYVNSITNETRYLATSKFEPTFARRAFPCFDEPNMKATYSISIVHKPEYTALSNMDVKSTETADFNDQLQVTHFEKSVKMSTYLVCFIVCDFEHVEAKSKRGIPVRVFATPDKKDMTAYALDMAKDVLDQYEKLFNINYPLPKLDLIAIPDFVSGAMEHWGLITFRDSALLYSPDSSTLASKKRVAQVVAHELAHQWFGNLVTMEWWKGLWLNEGFASYMEFVGTVPKEPTWNQNDQFLNDDLLPVMNSDAVINTHPIIVEVVDPAQITSIFDSISYSKGASVIRMLEGIMGKEAFFKGIGAYLEKFKWSNAETDDLWLSLKEALPNSGNTVDVKAIMDTWTLQGGYPYINITTTTNANGKTTISAKQKRFMSNPEAKVDTIASKFGYKWYVNLDYTLSTGSQKAVVMKSTDVTFEVDLDLSKTDNWIKFNKDKYGFYRVNYAQQLWDQLTKYLNKKPSKDWSLSPADRADLLSDAFNLATAALTPISVPLSMTTYLSKETHYVPWVAAAAGGLNSITVLLRDQPGDYSKWKVFMQKLVKPSLHRLGFADSGTFLERRLRALLFSLACTAGDKTASANADRQFREWLDQDTMPSVNLRGVIYTAGMESNGTEDDWDKIWGKYIVETNPSEKNLLMAALTSTKQTKLIKKLLQFAMEEKHIRRQDFFSVVRSAGSNHHVMYDVWDWMKAHYTTLEQRFTSGDRYFGRMPYYLVRQFKTPEMLQDVTTFFSQHQNAGSGKRYRLMALENIKKNINWMATTRKEILRWIAAN